MYKYENEGWYLIENIWFKRWIIKNIGYENYLEVKKYLFDEDFLWDII